MNISFYNFTVNSFGGYIVYQHFDRFVRYYGNTYELYCTNNQVSEIFDKSCIDLVNGLEYYQQKYIFCIRYLELNVSNTDKTIVKQELKKLCEEHIEYAI